MGKRKLMTIVALVILLYLYKKGYLDGIKEYAEKVIDNLSEGVSNVVKSVLGCTKPQA